MPGLSGVGDIAGGLLSGITGLIQKNKANKILQNNPYPSYNIPQEVFANQQIAQNMANEGLPSQQYQNAMKNIQRQQNFAVDAATSRRAGVGTIGAIQQQSNDASNKLGVADAQARLQNQKTLMNMNNNVAGYRDKAWNWNAKNKYLQNYGYGMGLLGAGNQNLTTGIGKVAAGAGSLLTGGLTGGLLGGVPNGGAPANTNFGYGSFND